MERVQMIGWLLAGAALCGCSLIAVPDLEREREWYRQPSQTGVVEEFPTPVTVTVPRITPTPTPTPVISLAFNVIQETPVALPDVTIAPPRSRMRRKIWPDFPWRDGWALYLIPFNVDQEQETISVILDYVNSLLIGKRLSREDQYDYVIIVSSPNLIYNENTPNLFTRLGWQALGNSECARRRRVEDSRYTICLFDRAYPTVKMSSILAVVIIGQEDYDIALAIRWNYPQP